MTRSASKLIPDDFAELPGLDALEQIALTAGDPAGDVEAIGYVTFTEGSVPADLGWERDALTRAGFEPAVGKTLVIPASDGPDRVALGAGDAAQVTPAVLRDVAAAFVRSVPRAARLALVVGVAHGDATADAAAIAEGAALARYRYTVLKSAPTHTPLVSLAVSLAGASSDEVSHGLSAGLLSARASVVARDVTNTPPGHLTATDLARISESLGERFGFGVEVFDKAALIELGCGGLLGVNQGSVEEPRMIKLTYGPDAAAGHLGLVGKGIMYDSGGISLKPSDPMHLLMKMDMGGAAAVLGAFTTFADQGVAAKVTGWLMCTDNMPSGTAYKLGDVLVARDGTTVEVKNTDAEGRLVMMDALALANEDGVDAIIDIATLTGAALMALGQATAPVFANDDAMAALLQRASDATGESVWRLPLERTYRPQLDSDIADISNLGGKYAGATTAALFLDHFVGATPWAHVDIAGTMQTDKDDAWRTAGATGFGARLLAAAAADFRTPV
ncbi:M17 family metallopeptidase [Microbacterium sp. RU33B]|uniref:leucyl aminopeptidase family protein n=1 Tax=Microbacterium sp. RU33B TaxID=1907390 RepID=UPI00096566E9|nr:leucyl aminopeptidase [Microbacterium sp. RU33B]SIT77096.1 leucyl aminopeptidase [Microbacterium sp. RU33B]